MKRIGGFFELESIRKREKPFLHTNAIALSSGRASLNLILKFLRPSRVYVPFYTCNALLEPIRRNKIPYVFYSTKEQFEPTNCIELKEDEYFIYINYFGLKSDVVWKLISKLGKKLILDNSQAFFEPEYKGVFSFNSARKFFGVPDGSFLYSPLSIEQDFVENADYSTNHLINRALGNFEIAYQEFLAYEESIACDVRKISTLSNKILKTIDYFKCAALRRKNYLYLQDQLGSFNGLKLELTTKMVPLCYPFLPEKVMERKKFYERGFFIPSFWQDVLLRENNNFSIEKKISVGLLPLPIDHRYEEKDLFSVSQYVKKYLKY